jgi:hypothetical protein
MEFVRVIRGYDHLWAVKEPDKESDELTSLFDRWNDAEFLFQFFKDNIDDLKSYNTTMNHSKFSDIDDI